MKNKSSTSFVQRKICSMMMNPCIALALSLALGLGQLQAAPESESTTTQPKADEAKWFTDFEAAKKLAAKENRPILLFFTGSDWCTPCKAFKQSVLEKEVFLNAVRHHWVLMEVDLPKDESKISAETLKQNNLVKEYFEIVAFPTLLVLSPDGKPLAKALRYLPPELFLEKLNPFIEVQKNYTQIMAEASQLEGKPKALALVKALDLVAEDQVRFHAEAINELQNLNKSGDAEVAETLLASIKQQKDTMAEDAQKRTLDSDFAEKGRLSWMTDLEAAKAKAAKEGKFLFIHLLERSSGAASVMLNNAYYQPDFIAKVSEDWVLVEAERPALGMQRDLPEHRTPEAKERARIWDYYEASVYRTVTTCAFADGRPFSLQRAWFKSPLDLKDMMAYLEEKKIEGDQFLEKLQKAKETSGLERANLLNEILYPSIKYRSNTPTIFSEQYAAEIALLLEADPESNQRVSKLVQIKAHDKYLLHNRLLPMQEKAIVYMQSERYRAREKKKNENVTDDVIDYRAEQTRIRLQNNPVKKALTKEEIREIQLKKGELSVRYTNEHDTTDNAGIFSIMLRNQATYYANLGDVERTEQVVETLLSPELAGTPGSHQQFSTKKVRDSYIKRIGELLELNQQEENTLDSIFKPNFY